MQGDKKFQRRIEDFRCANCGNPVRGDGYTNHCPACLYSMHVDINPGDRAETCRGLMAPVECEAKGGEYVIVHRCLNCGAVRRNKARPGDSMDALLAIVRSRADAVTGRSGNRAGASARPGGGKNRS